MKVDQLEFDFRSGCIEDLNEALRKYNLYIEAQNKAELRHAVKSAAEAFSLGVLFILSEKGIPIKRSDGKTVDFNASIKLLTDELKFSIVHNKEITDLKVIRNTFVHNVGTMSVNTITNILDKFMYSIILMFKDFGFDLIEMIDEELKPFFLKRSDYYKDLIEEKKRFVGKDNYMKIGSDQSDCPCCGEEGAFILLDEEENKYTCVICDAEDDAISCMECGDIYPKSEMSSLFRDYENYCPTCCDYYDQKFSKD